MKTQADYYRAVEDAQDELHTAKGRLRDAEDEHDQADKALATAEHELEEYLIERDKLNAETGLPDGCVPLAAGASREALYRDHRIRVSPAHFKGACRWLLVVHTPRGECMLQQWSREEHKTWTGAALEAIESAEFHIERSWKEFEKRVPLVDA